MSWSISKRGTGEEVAKYLYVQAPTALSHVQGVERSLADQALGLARAAVAASSDQAFEVSAVLNGSANFGSEGQQLAQTVNVTVTSMRKP